MPDDTSAGAQKFRATFRASDLTCPGRPGPGDRKGNKLESVPDAIMDEVLAKLATVFE